MARWRDDDDSDYTPKAKKPTKAGKMPASGSSMRFGKEPPAPTLKAAPEFASEPVVASASEPPAEKYGAIRTVTAVMVGTFFGAMVAGVVAGLSEDSPSDEAKALIAELEAQLQAAQAENNALVTQHTELATAFCKTAPESDAVTEFCAPYR